MLIGAQSVQLNSWTVEHCHPSPYLRVKMSRSH